MATEKTRPFIEVDAKPELLLAAAVLLRDIARRKTVFEFGSGGSTLWFADFVRSLISVEDDKRWYDSISAKLLEKGTDRVEYMFALTELLPNFIEGRGMFDVVFVDCRTQQGRRRSILQGSKHVKPGGWLVADDYTFPLTKKTVEGLRGRGWEVAVLSGVKTHPIKHVQVKASTAFCKRAE